MICTNHDDYVQSLQDEKGMAIWVAELSNGQTVYMDDQRPGLQQPSAWIRLGEHIKQNPSLSIASFYLKFRSNVQRHLPANQKGYFFVKNLMGFWGSDNLGFYIIGYLTESENCVIMTQKWKVPELMLVENGTRDHAKAGLTLIRNEQ